MMKVIKDEKDFTIEEGITIIDFYADWCGPCKMMTPLLEELDEKYPEIKILKVDVDAFPELMLTNSVTNIPTLDIYENGDKKTRKVGYLPKELLLKNMEQTTTFKRKI
jgi:thioredoxin 1